MNNTLSDKDQQLKGRSHQVSPGDAAVIFVIFLMFGLLLSISFIYFSCRSNNQRVQPASETTVPADPENPQQDDENNDQNTTFDDHDNNNTESMQTPRLDISESPIILSNRLVDQAAGNDIFQRSP
jgi:cytoskeletal protein RodZ